MATFYGGPLAGVERRLGGIGPPRLVVARDRRTGAIELGLPADQFDPAVWETFSYVLTERRPGTVGYAIEQWETEFEVGDRVATLVDDRWRDGTIERVYSEIAAFRGERRTVVELYGVRWDTWPRIGNGPDREGYYSEGHRADALAPLR